MGFLSGLGRAAADFDEAFVAAPKEARVALARLILRAGPPVIEAVALYGPAVVAGVTPELRKAVWNAVPALAFRALKGAEGLREAWVDILQAAPSAVSFVLSLLGRIAPADPMVPQKEQTVGPAAGSPQSATSGASREASESDRSLGVATKPTDAETPGSPS